ncbi:unnamed protein product, partial [Musa textilis]
LLIAASFASSGCSPSASRDSWVGGSVQRQKDRTARSRRPTTSTWKPFDDRSLGEISTTANLRPVGRYGSMYSSGAVAHEIMPRRRLLIMIRYSMLPLFSSYNITNRFA